MKELSKNEMDKRCRALYEKMAEALVKSKETSSLVVIIAMGYLLATILTVINATDDETHKVRDSVWERLKRTVEDGVEQIYKQ